MTDQEQAPLDLADLQADFEKAMAHSDKQLATFALRAIPALADALQAANERLSEFEAGVSIGGGVLWGKYDTVKAAQEFIFSDERARDDLARVEADAKKWQEEAEQIHREDTELESRYEAAQGRIAELEGSLRELLDEHTTDTMIPYWEGDVQHLRYGNCECSVCVRARANLAEPQTPAAS